MAAPGFRDATEAATRAGFTPLLRPSGERAVAYTHEPLVIHHVRHAEDPRQGHQARFEYFGGKIVDTLRVLGIHAELGAVPGEYCPGAHSINARGERKLVGTAQRVLRHAWLFATLIIKGDEQLLANVLADVYRPMGASFDPDSVGSLRKENPALTNDVVTAAVLQSHTAQPSPRSLGMGSDCPLGQRLGSAS